MAVLDAAMVRQGHRVAPSISGAVSEVTGLSVRVDGLPAPVGGVVRFGDTPDESSVALGEVVGFDHGQTVVMPLGSQAGIRLGDRVTLESGAALTPVGPGVVGRVINAVGEPIDGGEPLRDVTLGALDPKPVDPMDRPVIDQPLSVGVRAVDAMATLGRGQRLGVFASPGLGKSTLLGMMARQTEADVTVVALVGERGREVRDFVDRQLGPEGLRRAAVFAATGDESPLLRLRAAKAAASAAEWFRDAGLDVLLIMDSITRFCQAQRQIGLAAGEPPATKGFPPSVFAMLPSLLERAGRTSRGSITGLYAVLVEGEELTDPIADAARGVLDGHLSLSRRLAERGHWPAIDVLGSISRVANDVTDRDHRQWRQQLVRLMSDYREVEELVQVGAYAAGSNPDYDLAIACKDVIDQLLQQGLSEKGFDLQRTRALMQAVVEQTKQARTQLERQAARGRAGTARG